MLWFLLPTLLVAPGPGVRSHCPAGPGGVVGPAGGPDVFRPVPAGVQFDVVAVEGDTATTKHLAVSLMRHAGDPRLGIKCGPGEPVAVGAAVVDVEGPVAGRHAVPEVVPGRVQGALRNLDRRPDLMS